MSEEDTWIPPEPTAADFDLLERIAGERAAIEAATAADRQGEVLRRHLLGILDRMEEAVCVHGHRETADEIAAGWRQLAAYDRLLGRDGRPRRRARRGTSAVGR